VRPCNRLEEDICIEREKVSEFIQEQLDKKYIRPSKLSPVLVLFVDRKNGKKDMVQDHRYLNKWTVKNDYPLPLILTIVENKKVFTKLDL